ncbi:MAG TPA: hypothetical protein VK611_11410 [Acidimicrobiales bacterium]|nr:hypothetical protein [Acidimicrobiales bacterium]
MYGHRYRLGAAAAALALVTLVAAGCGDDDDDDATADETAETPESDSGGGGADLAAYCEAELGLETAPEPEVDWETASPEEIATAVKGYAADTMRPLATQLIDAAPDELGADIAVLDQALTDLEESGDFAVFETPDALAAQEALHVFDLDNCGWATVDVTLGDYSFDGIPAEVDAGVVSFELANEGTELHELLLLRKNDGVTQPVEELLALPEEEAMSLVTPVGAPATPAPGTDGYSVAELEPGDYIAVCFIPMGTTSFDTPPAADAPPHFTQGMVTEFSVA